VIIDEIRNIESKKKDLRSFGLTMGVVAGLLGGLFLWRDKDHYLYFLAVSGRFFRAWSVSA